MKDKINRKNKILIATVISSIALIILFFLFQIPIKKYVSQKAAGIGNYYFNGGEYNLNKAEKFYKKALKFDDKNWYAYYQLARIDFVKNRFYSGIINIDRALAIDPENKRSYYVRGLLNGYRGNYDEAEKDFQNFIAWHSNEWAGYADLSWIYINDGKYEEAILTASNALSIFPENVWLYANKGLAQYKLGRYDEAKADLETAKKLAEKINSNDWKRAYPGNNPADAEKGVEEIKTAINYNLKLTYRMVGDENKADELKINPTELASFSKYAGKKNLEDGITLSACESAEKYYHICSGYTCQAIPCERRMFGWNCAASNCSSDADCCTINGCWNNTCRDDQCYNNCGEYAWGEIICPSYCDQEKCVSTATESFLRRMKGSCQFRYLWCDISSFTYGSCIDNQTGISQPVSWEYYYNNKVDCCTDYDCQTRKGTLFRCEPDHICKCYPDKEGCGSEHCKNIENACWNGCDWEDGTKDCCTPDPESCKNDEELREAAAKTCKGSMSKDECGGYTCEGTMNCTGWREQPRKN